MLANTDFYRWSLFCDFLHGLSHGRSGRSSATPLVISAHGDSTPTRVVTFTGHAGASDSIDCALHTHLPLALGACLHAASSPPLASADDTGHGTLPPLAASTGGGGRSSLGVTTLTTSTVSFTEQEIVRLRDLLIAFDSSLPGAPTSTSSID